jgi:hypothetical protein
MLKSVFYYRPFSHEAPTFCPVPGSTLYAKIYPARLELYDFVTNKKLMQEEFSFGPLEQFTVTSDLEAFRIVVSGFSRSSYIRYTIDRNEVLFLKGSDAHFPIPSSSVYEKKERERLFLGVNKAQDVAMMWRRKDIKELLPFLYFFSQSLPTLHEKELPKDSLFSRLDGAPKQELEKKLLDCISCGFYSLFMPRLVDDFYLGYDVEAVATSGSPLVLFEKFFPRVRRLFFEEDGENLFILPKLPTSFHCGRLLDIQAQAGNLSMEWSKGSIRRLRFVPRKDGLFAFKLDPAIRRFRLHGPGKHIGFYSRGDKIAFSLGLEYELDRFER